MFNAAPTAGKSELLGVALSKTLPEPLGLLLLNGGEVPHPKRVPSVKELVIQLAKNAIGILLPRDTHRAHILVDDTITATVILIKRLQRHQRMERRRYARSSEPIERFFRSLQKPRHLKKSTCPDR